MVVLKRLYVLLMAAWLCAGVVSAAPLQVQEQLDILARTAKAENGWFVQPTQDKDWNKWHYAVTDLNHDGTVDVFDLGLLKREMFQPTLNRKDRRRADTGSTGEVGVADVINMTKYLLGLSPLKAIDEKTAFQYAIDAEWRYGVTEDLNAGFKEKAYVNLDNRVGSYIEFEIWVPREDTYDLKFRFANGSANARPMSVETDGGAKTTIEFDTTGAWTTWDDRTTALPLKEGRNRIRLTSESEEGGPNLDYIYAAPAMVPTA